MSIHFTITDGSCVVLSTLMLALMLTKARYAFKHHSQNIYGYLMFLLILNAVIG